MSSKYDGKERGGEEEEEERQEKSKNEIMKRVDRRGIQCNTRLKK